MTTRDQTLITVVSGLPRSGTSLMMSMLEAGGLPPLTDDIRQADEDNPKGYYEYEHVKKLKEDAAWLADARGKSVKIISALLMQLPAAYTYKVVFMRRNMREILASQRHMLVRRGEAGDPIGDEEMSALFNRHLQQVETMAGATAEHLLPVCRLQLAGPVAARIHPIHQSFYGRLAGRGCHGSRHRPEAVPPKKLTQGREP